MREFRFIGVLVFVCFGLLSGCNFNGHRLVNVNTASESELAGLPGISVRDARRIVDGRPYADKHDLVVKGVITEDRYQKIRERISSK